MNPPPGYVRLTCADPALDVVCLLGPEPVRITAGTGGWEITPRPRQVGMTTWSGVEPLQVELGLMFDGWAAQTSQETSLARLFTVARGDDVSEPGIVRVEGVLLPADAWVIEDVAYDDVIVDATTRERLRQALTLTLREYVSPTYLQVRRRALQGTKGKTRVVTVKKGETPAKIAKRVRCKWTDLRTLNPSVVKKANQTLKTGTKLRAPVAVVPPKRAKGAHKTSSKTKR